MILATIDEGDRVYLAELPRGPIAVLEGSAAVVWRCASTGPLETIAERVAAATGAELDEIRDEVNRFAAHLRDQGLLGAG